MKNKDPRDFGYFMPGEWHDHEACWMAWPARVDLWPDIEATKKAYGDVANTIAEFEPLKLVVRPSMLEDAKKFSSYFGQDVVNDLLGNPPSRFGRKEDKRLNFNAQRELVIKFKQNYCKYDVVVEEKKKGRD